MPQRLARKAPPRLSTARIAAATRLVAPALRDTPLRTLERLGASLGCTLHAKDETTNPLGCFKGRGADAFLAARVAQGRREPLVCASAGNFGLALADAARRHGVGVTVFVAVNANAYKVARIASAGGAVVRQGDDFDAAKAAARAFATLRGLAFVEDGVELEITEGAGTIGVELDAVDEYDDLVVPVGNGALLAGVATWIRARRPGVRIVAACSAHAPVMRECWRKGIGAALRHAKRGAATIADGIAVREPVAAAVADLAPLVDEFLAVDDDALRAALRALHREEGIAVEPSAVAGIAAIATNPRLFRGRRIVTVLTGANLTDAQRAEYFQAMEATT
ncbi:MAG TPA: pyridoxal-phosphate dependent enzyme [Xanthomonadales bacterium]|nr:pyridoxal-phosphate dependent enzyme [Xanthomonadales bacterium]